MPVAHTAQAVILGLTSEKGRFFGVGIPFFRGSGETNRNTANFL